MSSFYGWLMIPVVVVLVFMHVPASSARTCSVSELFDVCKCISDDHAQCFVDSRCELDSIYGFVDKLEIWIPESCDAAVLYQQVRRIDYGRVIVYGESSCYTLPRCTKLVVVLLMVFSVVRHLCSISGYVITNKVHVL